MSIYLIRHGQTAGNAERRLQTPDVPLDDAGFEQARRLGERLRNAGIAGVESSPAPLGGRNHVPCGNGCSCGPSRGPESPGCGIY